jgi:uncharacterized protein YkwD
MRRSVWLVRGAAAETGRERTEGARLLDRMPFARALYAAMKSRGGLIGAVAALCVALTVSGLSLALGGGSDGVGALPNLAARAAHVQQTAQVSRGNTSARTPDRGAPAQTANGCAITREQRDAEQYVLTLLNGHRAQTGAAPLALSPALTSGAREHSCDMYQHHLLSHASSDGTSPLARIQASGLAFHTWGENIGTGSGEGLIGGVSANDAMMIAEPVVCCDHAWNILNTAHTQVGIGIIYINGTEWMTEDFIG